MHIVRSKFIRIGGKVSETILLMESYRENKKVKKRTVANLSHCTPQEIAAIEFALAHKHKLNEITNSPSIDSIKIREGLSIGAIWVLYQLAERLGIVKALGSGQEGKLALWQVFARILDQGSRLSAVRLSETHALTAVLNIKDSFCEDDLYQNLSWLAQRQAQVEDHLFKNRKQTSTLFLYDVTSSYLEGEHNELAAYGYNRDQKKGKKQIVIGLLCDEEGSPVTTEVFQGNTQDLKTFSSQIQKVKERFGCENITFVGDRGMIKSGQIEGLEQQGFYYITAITKMQIETLIKNKFLDYTLFDNQLIEIQVEGIRYILRRNSHRAEEIKAARESKRKKIEAEAKKLNQYLIDHPKAKLPTALKRLQSKIDKLGVASWITITTEDIQLQVSINPSVLEEESRLDGCYAIKTNLSPEKGLAEIIHARYKDLSLVERAFRTSKSEIELRPIYVRKKESTYGHVFVVMLAYLITRELDKAWSQLYLTVQEGLASLSTLCLMNITVKEGLEYQQAPEPREQNKKMLSALNLTLPKVLPKNDVIVVTRKARRGSASKH